MGNGASAEGEVHQQGGPPAQYEGPGTSGYPSRPPSRPVSRAPSRAVSRRNSVNSHVSSATWRSALRSARIQHSGLRKLRAAALGNLFLYHL